DMLSKGFAYNTIVGYRTAVSETHEHVDGHSIETHLDNVGGDLATILALDNWSRNSVYQRFYRGDKVNARKEPGVNFDFR
ncbi:hypothetical protein RhiirA4_402604, partial [Rhizophagus irregularis]